MTTRNILIVVIVLVVIALIVMNLPSLSKCSKWCSNKTLTWCCEGQLMTDEVGGGTGVSKPSKKDNLIPILTTYVDNTPGRVGGKGRFGRTNRNIYYT